MLHREVEECNRECKLDRAPHNEKTVFTNRSYWREKKIPFITARSITLISHQSKHKLMQMVKKDASGSGTTNWLLFALVLLICFFFSLFLKLVISLLLKNLKSLSWSLCAFNSPDHQVSESCTPTYTYICYTYQNY